MVRRILSLLLAALLLAGSAISALASVPYLSDAVSAPVLKEGTERDTGTDRVISLTYTARVAEVEAVRKAYLQELLKTRTIEEIADSNGAWLLHETLVFCEASPDGAEWYAVKSFAPTAGKAELSLFGDVLPAMDRGGADLSRRVYGFDYSLRLVTASDDYDPQSDGEIFACSVPTEALSFRCPAFTFLDCEIPEDASMPADFSAFMPYPNEAEIALPYPTRPGYFFAGWLQWNGGYTETAPAGSRHFRATAQWDARTYAVNYVLSTVDNPAFSYSFGRADNGSNPTAHTVGDSETLYDIKSPVGGYAFDGWYLSKDFSGEKLTFIPEATIGDLILYAKWITFEELEARRQAEREAYARSKGYGDLDDDGSITPADARLALRASVYLEKLPQQALERADLFATGIITPATARTILRVAVGLDSLYIVLYNSGIIRPGELDG